jgi:hypothetical protein
VVAFNGDHPSNVGHLMQPAPGAAASNAIPIDSDDSEDSDVKVSLSDLEDDDEDMG